MTRVDAQGMGDRSTGGPVPTQGATLDPHPVLQLCGIRLDHLSAAEVLDAVHHQLADRHLADRRLAPLALGSVNVDHVYHFGVRRDAQQREDERSGLGTHIDWLMLVDGAPVARRAGALTGLPWPRVTGADLLPDLLTACERSGANVGFLGGHPDSVPELRRRITARWPDLGPVSFWTPPPSVIDDELASGVLAATIAEHSIDLLVVGLGKPRQEWWIETHGRATNARVLAAFGAAADFLAGSARRAPLWMRRAGCEWVYRFVREPRRLARRYLLEGPGALWKLHRAVPEIADAMKTSPLPPPARGLR